MKGIYIAAVDLENQVESGVIKKIYGQVKAFKNLGIDMSISHINKKRLIIDDLIDNKIIKKPSNYNFHKILLENYREKLKSYDFAYIRFSRGDINYFKLIKFLDENNIKVIVEIPTYPYIQQYSYYNAKHLIYGVLDIVIWNMIKKHIYRISTTNINKEINNIKCVNISNGIDIDCFKMVKEKSIDNTINLVGIANISRWHGYDRVIKGIKSYVDNKKNSINIKFFIIGEGNEKKNLEKLINDLKLNDNVKLLGAKTGKELDMELDKMHVGISSLALFRAGGGHDPIKSKEFLARGIPVVLAYEDRLIDNELPYVMKVPEDESSIDIELIIKKVKQIQFNNNEIRDYAIDNLSWYKQMEKIVKCLNE